MRVILLQSDLRDDENWISKHENGFEKRRLGQENGQVFVHNRDDG
jgi:hypothetical protein